MQFYPSRGWIILSDSTQVHHQNFEFLCLWGPWGPEGILFQKSTSKGSLKNFGSRVIQGRLLIKDLWYVKKSKFEVL